MVSPLASPKVLLFDLGGVVLDIDFNRALESWLPHSRLTLDELKRAFSYDDHYERHERGEIEADEYFEHLTNVLHLSSDLTKVADGWNAIFLGEIAETIALIEKHSSKIPCYGFSNTNAAHMEVWKDFPRMTGAFKHIFTSHEIGLRKPERASFEHVANKIDSALPEILFFDDSPTNVKAAARIGMQTVLVKSPDDVRSALGGLGI